MVVQRFGERVLRWTARHPEWWDGADWGPDVGCVLYRGDDAAVLIDPLLPDDRVERERFLLELDDEIRRAGLPVATLLTASWHRRHRDAVARRYAAWTGQGLPAGVEGVELHVANETVYWLPGERALVPGDSLLGGPDRLRLPPVKWLDEGRSVEQVRVELLPLLDLPVELILPTHGEPVVEDAATVLAAALEPAAGG